MSENPVSILRWRRPSEQLPKQVGVDVLAVHKGYPEAPIPVKAKLLHDRPEDFLWWADYPMAPVARGPVKDRRRPKVRDRRAE